MAPADQEQPGEIGSGLEAQPLDQGEGALANGFMMFVFWCFLTSTAPDMITPTLFLRNMFESLLNTST